MALAEGGNGPCASPSLNRVQRLDGGGSEGVAVGAFRAVVDGPADVLRAQRLRHRCRAVYFFHMILTDSDSGAAMPLAGADLAGVHHAEPLNPANLDLAVK